MIRFVWWLCFLRVVGANMGGGSPKRAPGKRTCGIGRGWTCEPDDASCLNKQFGKVAQYSARSLFKLDSQKDLPDNVYLRAMKSVNYGRCNQRRIVWPEHPLCGDQDTKYYGAIVDRVGRLLECASSYSFAFELSGNTTRSLNTTQCHALTVASWNRTTYPVHEATVTGLNQLHAWCQCLEGEYVAIVGVCNPTSTAMKLHVLCMLLTFGIALPVGYSLKRSSARVRTRSHTAGGCTAVFAVLCGWLSPEFVAGWRYSALSTGLLVLIVGYIITIEWCPSRQSTKWCTRALQQTHWYPFAVFCVGPLCAVLGSLKALKICFPDEALTPHNRNECPAHVGVGFALSAYGIAHALYSMKALRLEKPPVWYENRALCLGGAILFSLSFVFQPQQTSWPWTGFSFADNQHMGLYLVLFLFPLLGIAAVNLKLVPPTWNLPAVCSAGMIGLLLVLHDPQSHGFHKQLHVFTGYTWMATLVCRAMEKSYLVGLMASLTGILFTSVTFAHSLMNTFTQIDVLAWFFLCGAFGAVLNLFVLSIWGLICYLNQDGASLYTDVHLNDDDEHDDGNVGVSAVVCIAPAGH